MNLPDISPGLTAGLAGRITFDYVGTLEFTTRTEHQQESYRRLLEEFDKAFPSGRVPDPIIVGSSLLNSSPS